MKPLYHAVPEIKTMHSEFRAVVEAPGLLATSAALTIPLALFPVMGYEINPAFLLAAVVAWGFVATFQSPVNLLFAIAGALGLLSVCIANAIEPDERFIRNILSLTLFLFPASFFFLGRYLVHDLRKAVFWLATFSAIFIIPVAVRLTLIDAAVRSWTKEGYSFLNAEFFGLPVFAAYGVNALAHLLCLQATILCGAILSPGTSRPFRMLFVAATAGAFFLIMGSEARSAQIYIVLVFISLAFYARQHPEARRLVLLPLLALGLALIPTFAKKGPTETRIAYSATTIRDIAKGEGEQRTVTENIDVVSTGRFELWTLASAEIAASPIIGTGFSQWGRYTSSKTKATNSGTHVYYLTYLWKGGLLFAIPFTAFLLTAAREAYSSGRWTASPEGAFTALSVVLMFAFLALTYDTPNVPSAGALAFFLLGALSGDRAAPAKDRT
jgi:O-antigen ligase